MNTNYVWLPAYNVNIVHFLAPSPTLAPREPSSQETESVGVSPDAGRGGRNAWRGTGSGRGSGNQT